MEFLGNDTVRRNIVVEGTFIKKIQRFSFLGCDISYEFDRVLGKNQ